MDYLETIVGVTATIIIVFMGLLVVCFVCPSCPLANSDCCCLSSQRNRRRQPEDIYVANSIYYQPCGTYHPGAAGTLRHPAHPPVPGHTGTLVPGHAGSMYQPIETTRSGHPAHPNVPIHTGTMYHPNGTARPCLPTQPNVPGHGDRFYQPVGPYGPAPIQRPEDAPPTYESLERYQKKIPKQEDANNKSKS